MRQNDFARFQPVGSARISEYLAFGYLSGADTFYSSVSKLMPGHWLELTDTGKLHVEQYWDLQAVSDESPQGEAYCVQSYRELLEGAVNSHLMSDVPLGGFLRGGVDSSPVAALMTKIRREPIETFSVGYSEQNYSELPYARRWHNTLIQSTTRFSSAVRIFSQRGLNSSGTKTSRLCGHRAWHCSLLHNWHANGSKSCSQARAVTKHWRAIRDMP